MKYCAFFGHRNIFGAQDLKERLKNEIKRCVKQMKIYNFLIGGYGSFDYLCAECVKELKQEMPKLKSILVLAYINRKNEIYSINGMCDESVYPDIENVPKRFAIIERNKWMVNNSDYLVFYVNYSWGGASKMLEFAQKKKKLLCNLGSL